MHRTSMVEGGEFQSGEEFDLFFENLDFIESEEDQELDAVFGDAVNEVCNGKICKINCVCNRPLELDAGLIVFCLAMLAGCFVTLIPNYKAHLKSYLETVL